MESYTGPTVSQPSCGDNTSYGSMRIQQQASLHRATVTFSVAKMILKISLYSDHFNYLGSVIDKDGTIGRDVDLRVLAAWSSCRKFTGVLYDRKIPLKQRCMRPLSDRL